MQITAQTLSAPRNINHVVLQFTTYILNHAVSLWARIKRVYFQWKFWRKSLSKAWHSVVFYIPIVIILLRTVKIVCDFAANAPFVLSLGLKQNNVCFGACLRNSWKFKNGTILLLLQVSLNLLKNISALYSAIGSVCSNIWCLAYLYYILRLLRYQSEMWVNKIFLWFCVCEVFYISIYPIFRTVLI